MTGSSKSDTNEALPADFAAFYSRFAPGLLAFFTRRTFDVDVACDLVAETFAQAFVSRGRFRGTSDREAASWLYGIGAHQLARYIRRGVAERKALEKLGLQVPVLGDDDYARITELAGLSDLRAAVAQEFSRLPVEQQQALHLRIVHELPYSEVADRLHISEPTARARASRGLRQLGNVLEGLSPKEVAT